MNDYTVTVIQDQHVPDYVPGRGMITTRRVGIMIGNQGPFYNTFTAPDDTFVAVNNWKQQMLNDARAVREG
jgi:hypothetical protein